MRFTLLHELFTSMQDVDMLRSLCQGVINISKIDYKEKKDGQEKLMPIFHFDLTEQVKVA